MKVPIVAGRVLSALHKVVDRIGGHRLGEGSEHEERAYRRSPVSISRRPLSLLRQLGSNVLLLILQSSRICLVL